MNTAVTEFAVNDNSSHVSRFTRPVAVVALVAFALAAFLATQNFYGLFYFVLANYEARSPQQHIELLQQSLAHDSSMGYANLMLARTEMAKGNYAEAENLQETGMRSFSSVRGYEQAATIQLKLGHRAEARELFREAHLMNPADVPTLEQLAAIAWQENDPVTLEELTREMLRLDLNNLNALYFRAKDAERRQNWNAALLNYQTISARMTQSKVKQGLFFTTEEIQQRIADLRTRAGNG